MTRAISSLFATSLLAACSQNIASGPATPAEPEVVGHGTISTEAPEFAFSLSPDGRTAYFNRIGEGGEIFIQVSRKDGDAWGPSSPIHFSDSRYPDVDPFVSRDGTRLYFSSTRPRPGSATDAAEADMDTWYAEWTGDGWSVPAHAGDLINSPRDEVFVSEAENGTLAFARFGEGEGRDRPTQIMLAARDGNGFAEPQAIATLPADLRLSNPAIAPNGNLMVVSASTGPEPDLYVSRRNIDDSWTEFTALPEPINSPDSAEFAPYIGNEGKTLYFTSERGGQAGRAIYRAELPG
ncbi:hypothetical protein FF098_011255 [Parvularcula flava]|uniref:WD40-like Beta Propeller Repeat n=1 Tax=Aquisalinus luteolus TaxID=1566827 RepID=A0A8J3A2Q8_9PROT|nr:PD40 domain-containing protein [Aquisalinus luteolus]NHK28484.1 hypothetical protein [Aquisalinus luteolus]GGH98616.1 hypothetical protein GCM10011355_22630 [Aquisalinus luteolus]